MKVLVGVLLLAYFSGVSLGQEESTTCTKGSDCGRGKCCVKAVRGKREAEQTVTGTCQAYKAKGQSCIVATNKLRWPAVRGQAVVDCPCQKKQANVRLFCKANGTSVVPQGAAGTCEPKPKRGRGNRKGKGKGRGRGNRKGRKRGGQGRGKGKGGNRQANRKARQERRQQRAQNKAKSTQ